MTAKNHYSDNASCIIFGYLEEYQLLVPTIMSQPYDFIIFGRMPAIAANYHVLTALFNIIVVLSPYIVSLLCYIAC